MKQRIHCCGICRHYDPLRALAGAKWCEKGEQPSPLASVHYRPGSPFYSWCSCFEDRSVQETEKAPTQLRLFGLAVVLVVALAGVVVGCAVELDATGLEQRLDHLENILDDRLPPPSPSPLVPKPEDWLRRQEDGVTAWRKNR